MENELNFLSRKDGFNSSLRHFRQVTRYVGEVQDGGNLADMINLSLEEGEVFRGQVRPILNALLVEKFQYAYKSYNILRGIEEVDEILSAVSAWTKIQLIVSYASPEAGLYLINPKKADGWEQAVPLMKDELVVIYAGPIGTAEVDAAVLQSAVLDFIRLLNGEKVELRKDYVGVEKARPVAVQAAAAAPKPAAAGAAPAAPTGKKRMTPRYGVLVTNELFHNGNVESWKRIIESYRTKYPGLDVLIWYENERINDINALFKWGKVKHGNPIMISVVGDDIKDVSKLQKYLFEGASPRFEAFLRGAVHRVLDLF